jgi:DNA-binding NarL/FixJ family response regulator
MSSVSILVVDDYEPWRQRICSRLREEPDLRVGGEVSDGVQAVQRAEELKPDLILLDIGLPNLNGIEVAERLHQRVPGAKILFLTQNNDAEVVRAALSNGALGYVLKADAGSELLPAIKAVLRGSKFVSSGTQWNGFNDSGDA